MRVICHFESFSDSLGVLFKAEDGKSIAEPINFTIKQIDGGYMQPTLRLTHDEPQQLMNELWRCGIRPKNGEGTDAQVNALKYHLEDMRKLVFKDKR